MKTSKRANAPGHWELGHARVLVDDSALQSAKRDRYLDGSDVE